MRRRLCAGRCQRLARVLGAALLLTPARSVPAQEPILLREDPAPPCEIELVADRVFAGGGVEDDWVANTYDGVEALAGGRLALTEQLWSERFLVASPDVPGGRWVGRGGEGPGEYRFIRWLRAHGDRLHVFDRANMRRTVLDARDFEVIHTNPLSSVKLENDAVVLTDSSYLINGTMYTPERIEYVLHLFNGEGEVVRSFDEIPFGVPDAPSPLRWLTPARHGGVWSAAPDEYRIDLWDVGTGKRQRSLVRDVGWFPPNGPHLWHPDRLDPPRIRNITEDARGRLWVLLHVAAAKRWAECFERTPPGSHPEAEEYMVREGCFLYDTRIEVLDSESGRILALGDIPPGIWQATDGGLLYSVEEGAFGFPTVRLWKAALRPAENSDDAAKCGEKTPGLSSPGSR